MAGEPWEGKVGTLEVRRSARIEVVGDAPPWIHVTLELIASAELGAVRVRRGELTFGTAAHVSYRVCGWNDEVGALVCELVEDRRTAP